MEGLTGTILVGVESTYGTEASTKVAQYGISSTAGTRRSTARSKSRLSGRASRARQLPSYVDGEIVCGFTRLAAIMSPVLGALGEGTASTGIITYAIGDSDPDNTSLTVGRNHGSAEYTSVGNVPSSFRLELGNDDATYTLGFGGKSDVKEASLTSFTAPDEANILYPSGYGTLSINGTDYDFESASIEVSLPIDYNGKGMIGASTVRNAFRSGAMEITGSITLEFDDDAGADMDTVAMLADYLTDGDMGTIKWTSAAVDWLVLSVCKARGDWPALQSGVQTFSLTFDAESCDIVTTT